MRRAGVLLSLVVVVLLEGLALHSRPLATAQEATPAVWSPSRNVTRLSGSCWWNRERSPSR